MESSMAWLADSSPAGKRSWWGCGNHVAMVMDAQDESTWCTCTPRVERDGREYPPMADKADS